MFVALSQQQQSKSIIRNTTWILQGNTSDLFALKIKKSPELHHNQSIFKKYSEFIMSLFGISTLWEFGKCFGGPYCVY